MYLSEEKRAEIRKCFKKHQYNIGLDPGENKISNIKGFHDTEGVGKFPRFYLMPGMGKKCLHRFELREVFNCRDL